jgi:heat shock protein HslJ
MLRSRRIKLVLAVIALASLIGGCRAGREPQASARGGLDLAATEWELISLNGESLIEGASITLFFEEEYLGGSMTCNGYGGGPDSGKYTATKGGTLTISQLAVTVQLCSEPEGIMEQEETYIEALLSASTYRVIEGRLEIADVTGATMLVFSGKTGR